MSVAPHLENAIGGVRFQIPDAYVSKAQAALLEEPDTIDLRDDLVCPKCGSTEEGEADMSDHGKKDSKKEQKKQPKLTLMEKRKLKKQKNK